MLFNSSSYFKFNFLNVSINIVYILIIAHAFKKVQNNICNIHYFSGKH